MQDSDLIRGWTFRLQLSYNEIIKDHGLGLKEAVIRLDKLGKDKLGQWDKQLRLITLDFDSLEKYSWQDIMMILKHEIAHQFVDEARQGGDGKAHGKAFAEACTLLNIPSGATVSLTPLEEHPVSRKIEKLMALASSCNQHEAEAALGKAQELSFKYNVEKIKIESNDYSFRPLGPWRKKISSFDKYLVHILEEYYFVKALTCWRRRENDPGQYKQFEIYGTLENLETAGYVYDFLSRETEYLWKQYRRKHGSSVGRMRNSFINGLYHGFSQKLKDERGELNKKYEIVRLDDPQLQQFFQNCNPRIKKSSYSYRTNAKVYGDGVKTGEQMRLRPGIKTKAGNGLKGLLH